MIGAKERYQIQMNTGAFCKTEAVQDWKSLLKQRRRWFLGFITNEVCMITDIRLWRRYPILLVVRFLQNTIRTTALLFFIMVLCLLTTSQRVQNLPVGFIAVSLGLNWALMMYFGAILGRYKIMLYPLMFVLNPLFNWCYMVYGIFTAGQRTWGGPRADATKADDGTTPAQAIEQARQNGDDLNIDPDTFKAVVQRQKSQRGQRYEQMPLQPGVDMDGRFTQARPIGGGWYEHDNTSAMTLPELYPRAAGTRPITIHPRASWDSIASAGTTSNSIYIPRRIESFMSPEDANQYHTNQNQILADKPAGGEGLSAPGYPPMSRPTPRGMQPQHAKYLGDSLHSLDALQQNHRYTDRNGGSSGGSSPVLRAQSPQMPPAGLTPPMASLQTGNRDSSASRQGRSPLARQSYLRSAEDLSRLPLTDPRARSRSPAAHYQPQQQQSQQPYENSSSYFPHDDMGAESDSEDRRSRNRLTKDKWQHRGQNSR